ncbi:MAG: efflux RND transporter periplasmic adaptor subunit [Planctomycetes bacterium]|nr:efflux RND transporter periplasmic adaptor subunit [Planctomycetota bacterium]
MLTATAAAESLPTVVVAFGSLAANETVELAFRNSGRISKLDLDLGSAVKKGEIVGALDPKDFELAVRDVEAAVRQARVQLGLAADGDDDAIDVESTATVRQARAVLVEATLTRDRVKDLVERELRPPADLDAAVAAYGVAASRLQQAIDDVNSQQAALQQRRIALAVARRALAESVLVAPFDAEVVERRRRPPEFVAAGESVLRLLDVDPLRLRLRVPEREALRVAIGQVVVFTVDGIAGEFRGAVVRASPAIDGSDRTLLIEVEVENAGRRLRPGLFARASIEVEAPAPRVVVPADAVIAFAGVEKVFCVDADVARERRVRTGRRIGERVEIDDGLDAGAVVVRAPGELVDGSRVVVRAGPEKR